MIRRIVAGLAVLLVILAGGSYLYLRSSLPQTEGRIVLAAGPKAEVRIARDADGVPLIIARDDEDAAFGLGFVHAQDRLFQMELMRRYAAGRLAEIFGAEAVPARPARCASSGSIARRSSEILSLSPAVNRALAAYAAGVNAYLSSAPRRVAARIPAAALFPEPVAARRQPRLGQADGAADRRQLPRRIAARSHGADDFAGRPDVSLPRISETARR